jgi:hypothetical protein
MATEATDNKGPTNRLFKEPQTRSYLGGMSHATLWKLRQSGVIPTLRVGKSIYFDRADLDHFIDSLREAGEESTYASSP